MTFLSRWMRAGLIGGTRYQILDILGLLLTLVLSCDELMYGQQPNHLPLIVPPDVMLFGEEQSTK